MDLIDLGKVYSMLRWAWHYGYWATAGNHKRNLKVKVDTDEPDNTAFYRRNTNNLHFSMNMVDDIVNLRWGVENVYYHEFGHFFMFGIVGDNNWTKPSGISSAHTVTDNNFSDNMTMSEGTASGFSYIIDEMTASETDGESGISRWTFLGNPINFHGRVQLDADLNTPFLSEEIIARIMLDMWDGTGNNAAFGNPIGAAPVDQRRYFDDLNNGNGPQDNIELSFNTILSPFWENVGNINDLPTYFDRLVEKVSCSGKKDLRRLWLHNFSNHLAGGNPMAGVNPDDFMFLNTDVISEPRSVTYVGNEIQNRQVISTNTINQTFTADVSEFNITNDVINVAEPLSSFTIQLSDDLLIENGNSLELNSGSDMDFGVAVNDPSIPVPVPNTSPINSVGIYTVCSDLVRVADNGILQLGEDPTSPRIAQVSFSSGSVLDLGGNISNPSTLRVNDNSILTIEEGATLQIGPGTEVILDGPNAVLEIRGRLELLPGATFAPEGGTNGQGYVLFNIAGVSNQETALDHIAVSNNSAMVFEAANNNSKVLEVAGDNLWIDPNGTNFTFTLRTAKAVMHHNTLLNLGCQTTFDGAIVEKHPTAGHYTGVYLWDLDYRHTLKNSLFKDASEGLHFVGLGGNSFLVSTENQFSNNYNGLTVRGGGFYANTNIASNNNGYGILATGIRRNSTLVLSDISFNNLQGVRYESGVGSHLYMHSDNLFENELGMKFISRGNLSMSCTQIHGKSGFASPTGLEFFSGHLLMSPRRNSGPNSFKDNETSIWFRSDWGDYAKFNINDGFNRLSNKTTATSHTDYLGIKGIIENNGIAGVTNKVCDNNYWDASSTGPSTNYGLPGYNNYLLKQSVISGGLPMLNWITLTDASPINSTQLKGNWNGYCGTPLQLKRSFGGDGDIYPNDQGTVINTTNHTNEFLSRATERVLLLSSDNSVTHTEIIGRWQEVLTYASFPSVLTKEDEYYLDIGITNMFAVLGEYLQTLPNIDQTLITDNQVQSVLTVCNYWDTKLVNETSDYSRRFRNKVNLNKGHLYYMIDDNTQALNTFNSMQAWADSFALVEAGYWSCQIGQIEQLKASNYNVSLLQGMPVCAYAEDSTLQFKRTRLKPRRSLEFESKFEVYPNPAKGYFIVTYETDKEDELLTIHLVDLFGKQLRNLGTVTTHKGVNQGRISTDGLRAGTYLIRFTTSDGEVFKKLVLLD